MYLRGVHAQTLVASMLSSFSRGLSYCVSVVSRVKKSKSFWVAVFSEPFHVGLGVLLKHFTVPSIQGRGGIFTNRLFICPQRTSGDAGCRADGEQSSFLYQKLDEADDLMM